MNLAGLNADRVETVHLNCLLPYINAAVEFPLNEAYPILAWAIENSVKRFAKTDHARSHLVPMFEATLLGAELAGRIAARSLKHLKQVKSYAVKSYPAAIQA